MKTFYVFIADIHGEIEALEKALERVESYMKNCGILSYRYIFGGDFIDRGMYDRDVVMLVKKYVEERDAICLMGNHDMFLVGTADESSTTFPNGTVSSQANLWYINKGMRTCDRLFGAPPTHYDDGTEVPKFNNQEIWWKQILAYRDIIKKDEVYKFLKNKARLTYETENIYFCHAPQSDVKDITFNTLLWSRDSDYKNPKGDYCFKVPDNKLMSVHGHYHRLFEKIYFPRIVHYQHGGINRTVVLADSGCGCSYMGELHPVIIEEWTGDHKLAKVFAIL